MEEAALNNSEYIVPPVIVESKIAFYP